MVRLSLLSRFLVAGPHLILVRSAFVAAFPLFLLAACATRPPPPVEVAVTKSGPLWLADFHFPKRERAWGFVRSTLTESERPWRPRSWTVETPGVQLERRGHYDLLTATDGRRMPEWVRIRFAPFEDHLLADYDPALIFTDGSVALFSEQFDAFPLRSARRAERLPIDLSGTRAAETATRVTFRDLGGAVLAGGERVPSVSLDDDDGTYVLFGPAEPVETGTLATIIDPALPAWIRQSLLRDTPPIIAHYSEALGPPPGAKPTLMVSWAGPTPRLTSMGGSTLDALMVMRFEGTGVLVENERVRRQALWFIAHEAAHFWLGQAVTYQYSRDAWITEGGADLLAIRAVPSVDPAYDARTALQESVDDCAVLTAERRGVESAEERNEHRAYYACGVVFGLVAEAATDRPFAEFVRGLVEANRADRVVTRGDWLAALDASGDLTLSTAIARLLDGGAEDSKAAIASLFTRAGIAFTLAEDGTPRLH